ncbi:hypothetical protein CSV67_01990 [Sporosarcina sp. P2]|nr:hypothetical protein CSV67_01990 [Sporosarcina sp. P2]
MFGRGILRNMGKEFTIFLCSWTIWKKGYLTFENRTMTSSNNASIGMGNMHIWTPQKSLK